MTHRALETHRAISYTAMNKKSIKTMTSEPSALSTYDRDGEYAGILEEIDDGWVSRERETFPTVGIEEYLKEA